ncbi:MAG: PhoU domain-containing protein, partial [Hominenteromicrobium sp.]
FKISGNLERIGDHAMNICEYTKLMEEKNIAFSESARSEIAQMQDVSLAAMKLIYPLESITTERLEQIAQFEQKIDDMTFTLRQNQILRMHDGADESAVLYSELLTDFERIGDHILNIGEAMAQISLPEAFETA